MAKGCPLCPNVEMELTLLLQQSMCELSPAVPQQTRGWGQTKPKTWQPRTDGSR